VSRRPQPLPADRVAPFSPVRAAPVRLRVVAGAGKLPATRRNGQLLVIALLAVVAIAGIGVAAWSLVPPLSRGSDAPRPHPRPAAVGAAGATNLATAIRRSARAIARPVDLGTGRASGVPVQAVDARAAVGSSSSKATRTALARLDVLARAHGLVPVVPAVRATGETWETRVLYRPGWRRAAQTVARTLGIAAPEPIGGAGLPASVTAPVVVVAGSDGVVG